MLLSAGCWQCQCH